jgi:hypothetical protein
LALQDDVEATLGRAAVPPRHPHSASQSQRAGVRVAGQDTADESDLVTLEPYADSGRS